MRSNLTVLNDGSEPSKAPPKTYPLQNTSSGFVAPCGKSQISARNRFSPPLGIVARKVTEARADVAAGLGRRDAGDEGAMRFLGAQPTEDGFGPRCTRRDQSEVAAEVAAELSDVMRAVTHVAVGGDERSSMKGSCAMLGDAARGRSDQRSKPYALASDGGMWYRTRFLARPRTAMGRVRFRLRGALDQLEIRLGVDAAPSPSVGKLWARSRSAAPRNHVWATR